ncbi:MULTISPECIES: ABC transporter substrate-binding protein [unclassified Streptomyces]|jgi:iron(III) transport system substrate-binding protein|uniref:ABC transporter substrate-binding protein n=1 Tax=unclassified Streptomyces TaxID=2593676 RepID=UPI0037F68DC2
MISLSKACALAAACAVVLTACGSSAGTSGSATPTASVDVGKASPVTPLDAAVTARAKKQGSVLLYTNADAQQTAPITKAFEAKYPGIKLRVLNMNDAQTFQRYATETATGVRTADVVMATDSVGMLDFVRKGNVLDYTDPNLKNLPGYAQLAPGVVAVSEDPLVAVYNTALIPKKKQPKDLASLARLSTSIKGKVGTTDISNPQSFGAVSSYVSQQGDAGWKNLQALGPNTKVESGNGNLMQKLAQGEYQAAYFVSGSVRALIEDQKAAKILNYTYLKDATPLLPRAVAVTKKAASPDAAKLFVNFLLSVEGQQAACKGGFTPYRDGVDCAYGLPAVEAVVGADNVVLGGYPKDIVKNKATIVERWKKAYDR